MYYNNRDIRLEEMPVPEIGADELLVKVHASGICGSDLLEWYRLDKAPLVLGHEIAGEIVEVGGKLKKFKKGQRVSASHHVPCGECHYCMNGHETVCETLRKTRFYPGGFAEYVRIPAVNIEKGGVYPLPDNVSFEEGTFSEPAACVLRAQRAAGMKKGRSVLVIGSGISGLLHIMFAKMNKASIIAATDVSEYRLEAAKKFGANRVFHASAYLPEKFREINHGRLADIVLLCAGAPAAFYQAMESVERGGTVLIFSAIAGNAELPLHVNRVFWRNEVTILSSYANTPKEQIEAIELIGGAKFQVAKMITHRLRLEETRQGFALVESGKDCIKVIIQPHRKE